MKIARFRARDAAEDRLGLVVGDYVLDMGVNGAAINEVIGDWEHYRPQFESSAATAERIPLSNVTLLAPVPRPGKVFAIGLNYADHVAETGLEIPKEQVWFTKAQTSINDPYAPIPIAKAGQFTDYEAELVAIIGKLCKNVPVSEASSYVFGYCVGNDVSERKWQIKTPQWSLGKSFDGHGPIGPWITTTDEIGDPHRLGIRCLVNGEVRQDSNTKNLIFNIWDQIAELSQAMTLEPGDLIFTGTPGGVGVARDPRVFLQPGDLVRVEIEELGHIEGKMLAGI